MSDPIAAQAEELRPCPFCGGQAAFFLTRRGPIVDCVNIPCRVNPQTPICGSKEAAAEAWNTRAAPPEGMVMVPREPKNLDALQQILDLCPKADPGSAYDPYGGYKSEGNSGDIASDAVNEKLWEIAKIIKAALAAAEAPQEGLCVECGKNPIDFPLKQICAGCEAYREHQS